MSKKSRIPPEIQVWIDARKRHHLSHAHVAMARELGMNPKKLGKIDNHKQERWKAPLPIFIERCYLKSFGKERPEDVRPIEERFRDKQRRKKEKRALKKARREAAAAETGELFGPIASNEAPAIETRVPSPLEGEGQGVRPGT